MALEFKSVKPVCVCFDEPTPRIEIEVTYDDGTRGKLVVPILPVGDIGRIVKPVVDYLKKHGFEPE